MTVGIIETVALNAVAALACTALLMAPAPNGGDKMSPQEGLLYN